MVAVLLWIETNILELFRLGLSYPTPDELSLNPQLKSVHFLLGGKCFCPVSNLFFKYLWAWQRGRFKSDLSDCGTSFPHLQDFSRREERFVISGLKVALVWDSPGFGGNACYRGIGDEESGNSEADGSRG